MTVGLSWLGLKSLTISLHSHHLNSTAVFLLCFRVTKFWSPLTLAHISLLFFPSLVFIHKLTTRQENIPCAQTSIFIFSKRSCICDKDKKRSWACPLSFGHFFSPNHPPNLRTCEQLPPEAGRLQDKDYDDNHDYDDEPKYWISIPWVSYRFLKLYKYCWHIWPVFVVNTYSHYWHFSVLWFQLWIIIVHIIKWHPRHNIPIFNGNILLDLAVF